MSELSHLSFFLSLSLSRELYSFYCEIDQSSVLKDLHK